MQSYYLSPKNFSLLSNLSTPEGPVVLWYKVESGMDEDIVFPWMIKTACGGEVRLIFKPSLIVFRYCICNIPFMKDGPSFFFQPHFKHAKVFDKLLSIKIFLLYLMLLRCKNYFKRYSNFFCFHQESSWKYFNCA